MANALTLKNAWRLTRMIVLIDTGLLTKSTTQRAPEKENVIYICRACKTPITEERYLIKIRDDSFQHTFYNPHGFKFTIFTFGFCQSLLDISRPSYEYTWFSGYEWISQCCAKCLEHLGWRFQSGNQKPSQFFALIHEKIEKTTFTT
jgi:hypothetical protein